MVIFRQAFCFVLFSTHGIRTQSLAYPDRGRAVDHLPTTTEAFRLSLCHAIKYRYIIKYVTTILQSSQDSRLHQLPL